MKISNLFLIKGAAWTIGGFGFGQLLRLVTNVALARMLAPELFGIMVIVNSVRTGLELTSDVGIGQNIVHNQNAENPDFYNTAWTLGIIRSIGLWIIFCSIALPLAHFYETPVIAAVLPVYGFFFLVAALGSIAPFLLQKRIRFVRLNAFGAVQALVSSVAHILFAYFIRNIWALVFGILVAVIAQSISSYLILPGIRHRLYIAREYVGQIFSFGKWIFLSSIIYFFAMNLDRLYFAKVAALNVVGVYGIARTLSDLMSALILRLCGYLVFPLIAASQSTPKDQLRAVLVWKRFVLLLIGALSISILTATGDFIIKILYDQRYQAAGWMLPILSMGVWFSIISGLNESTLLGFGKPSYGAVGSTLKLIWLSIGLPVGFAQFGSLGVIVAFATSDIFRYLPLVVGQLRERFSFVGQDLIATLIVFGLIGFFEFFRWRIGYGTSFDSLPIIHVG